MIEFTTYIQNKSLKTLPARLELKILMFGGIGVGPKGEWFVTPSLALPDEVDHYINEIIENLEEVRIAAKAKLEENLI